MRTSLIVGATGGFGSAIARELARQEQPQRWLVRDPQKAQALKKHIHGSVEIIEGDARQLSAVLDAAKDCTTIFDGLNMPFSKWEYDRPQLIGHLVEASGLSGATLVHPASMFGCRPIFSAPQLPGIQGVEEPALPSILSRVQASLEQEIEQNCEMRNVRAVILRCGEWIGPRMGPVLAYMLANVREGTATWIGDSSIPRLVHSLDDVARVAVALAQREGAGCEVWNMPGELMDGESMTRALSTVTGKSIRLNRRPRVSLRVASWLNKEAGEVFLGSMLWENALMLEDRKTRNTLPEMKFSTLEQMFQAMTT